MYPTAQRCDVVRLVAVQRQTRTQHIVALVIAFCAHRAYIRPLAEHRHLLQPMLVLRPQRRGKQAEVPAPGRPRHLIQAVRQPLLLLYQMQRHALRAAPGRGLLVAYQFQRPPSRALDQPVHTALRLLGRRRIIQQNRNRLFVHLVADAVDGLVRQIAAYFAFFPRPLQLLGYGMDRRIHSILLGTQIHRNGLLMHPPVIQHLGDVHNAPRPFRQPQHDVMVLAAVKRRAVPRPRAFQKRPAVAGEMADIVMAPQFILAKARLKIKVAGLFNVAVKLHLVGIDKVRALFLNGAHHLVQRAFVQNVVMIQQPEIRAGSQPDAGVCIVRNAAVFLQMAVYDARILFRLLLADAPHIRVRIVAAVRRAQFPVRVGLRLERGYQRSQKRLRRVVQRRQNADFYRVCKLRAFLARPLLVRDHVQRCHLAAGLHALRLFARQPPCRFRPLGHCQLYAL